MSLGRVDGEELALPTAPGNSILTENVRLYGKALTVFANRKIYDRLSSQQQAVLRAQPSIHGAISRSTCCPSAGFCSTPAHPASMSSSRARRTSARSSRRARTSTRSSRPTRLPRSSSNRSATGNTRRLRTRRSARSPAACTRRSPSKPATAPGKETRPSLVNGTYRWALTLADAKSVTPPQTAPGNTYPMIGTAVLQDGSWRFISADHDHGTYSIHGNRIRFDWVNAHLVLIFEFTRGPDGSLHLKPVPPMDPGDQFVWSHKPWRRIGPPTPLQG